MVAGGLGVVGCGGFLVGWPVWSPSGGRCQAGAPAAAQRRGRTSLTPASGGRSSRARKGAGCGWLVRGRVLVPGCVAGGVVSQAPIRRRARRAGGCHDHVSGDRAAQSGDRARRWRRLMPHERAHPGLGDPPGLHWPPAAAWRWRRRLACSASRCQARVSSLRAIAMVAIFFPRRLAMAGRWRRTPGTAWRSAPPGSGPTAARPSPAWRCARAGRSGPSRAPSG